MTDFTVDRQQLLQAVTSFEQLATKADTIRQTLAAVPLTQPDFGRVPWLQSRVWEAYDQHTQDCSTSLTELHGALGNVGDGLESTAAAYRIIDDAAEEAAKYIVSGMKVGPA